MSSSRKPGRLVTQMEFSTVDEIMEIINQFDDALVDVNAIINGQVVNLTDFTEEELIMFAITRTLRPSTT